MFEPRPRPREKYLHFESTVNSRMRAEGGGNVSRKEVSYLTPGGICRHGEHLDCLGDREVYAHEEACANLLNLSLYNKNIPEKAVRKYCSDKPSPTLRTLTKFAYGSIFFLRREH